MRRLSLLIFCVAVTVAGHTVAEIEVTDDTGKVVQLDKPAQRIITLAPHLTELMFAVGAGNSVVATVNYSDFPAQASKIPSLGSFDNIKVESVLAYKPDLVLAWQSGNNPQQLLQMEKFGLKVFRSEPRELQHVARTLQQLGQLTGHDDEAAKAVRNFSGRLSSLKNKYQSRKRLSVFYQFWDKPMYTVNGEHLISDVLGLCGLNNIFANMTMLSATVEREAVIAANPDVIIVSGMNNVHAQWITQWQAWPEITAVRLNNIFSVNPDHLHRQTPRVLIAAEELCTHAEKARHKLKKRDQTH